MPAKTTHPSLPPSEAHCMTSKTPRTLALLLAISLVGACASTGVREAPRAPAAQPVASADGQHDNLNAVLWMQSSAEYRAHAQSVFGAAANLLDRALADPNWDALPRSERGSQRYQGLPPAIIVDADETVIDNSAYQARLIRDRQRFDADTWSAWAQERRAQAVPGALEFLRAAAQRGITVFYVTNRDARDKRATYDNLRALGFPMSEPEDTVLTIDESQGWTSAKGERRQFVGENYRVVMVFGDNLGDFLDGHSGVSPDARLALMEPYAGWWGSRWFMLANPSYGTWEGAITRGADEPTQAKRRALRTR